jgi:REP element-mobilizing transposase RayT
MPQSLAKIYIHLVFSTRNRERVLADGDGPDLHAYIGGILNGLGCIPLEINTEPDHAHILFISGRTMALSEVVGGVKKSATDWLRARSPRYAGFHWQSGYGAFSVSQSAVATVRNYIRNQREHHRGKPFEDEYRAMLEKHGMEYDERYVWE